LLPLMRCYAVAGDVTWSTIVSMRDIPSRVMWRQPLVIKAVPSVIHPAISSFRSRFVKCGFLSFCPTSTASSGSGYRSWLERPLPYKRVATIIWICVVFFFVFGLPIIKNSSLPASRTTGKSEVYTTVFSLFRKVIRWCIISSLAGVVEQLGCEDAKS
jgi:hypothetical protein